MLLEDSYQNFPLPGGEMVEGMFPTYQWYQAMAEVVPIKNKTLLDLGCCTFGYGVQALMDGAAYVTGVEKELRRVQQSQEVLQRVGDLRSKTGLHWTSIEDFYLGNSTYDIVLFSMIIHWLKNPEDEIRRFWNVTNEHMVLIYRHVNEGVDEPGYRPTVEALDFLIGIKHKAHCILSNTLEQNIHMVVYGAHL